MKATTHETAGDFLAVAGEWLAREEVVNNLVLGLASRIAAGELKPEQPPVMITVADQGGLHAAGFMTPPRPVMLYAPDPNREEALATLVDALRAGLFPVSGCNGPSDVARFFANRWAELTGKPGKLDMALRIYELRKVIAPPDVEGAPRLATNTDLNLAAEWMDRFSVDVGDQADPPSARQTAERKIAAGQLLLWERNGLTVSMAAVARKLPHGVAISQVYTPPEHRRHGYATACVAVLSQQQLDAGQQYCCLYTDLANATSNGIYQKIGYVPVIDCAYYAFGQAAT